MKAKASKLTSLLSTIVDNRGKTVPISESGFPLIATNCIKHSSIYPTFENVRYVDEKTKENWFRAHPKPNDIIFVNKGTPGRVCLVPDPVPFCFAQDMVGFRCDPEKIDFQYLFAVLRSGYIQKKIENFHVGLVIPHFKKGDLDNITIPRLASREEELAVGELYLTLSKKIELNNRINAELEAMAKILYDYWFVQFDFPFDFASCPEQRRREGKPDANGKPYKSSGGKMVYNPTLKREIPECWATKKLATLTSTIRRGLSPDYVEFGGIPVLNQKCIREQNIRFKDSRRHSTELSNDDERFLQDCDVLVNSTGVGTLGRIAFVKRLIEEKTTVDSHVTIVRACSGKISPEYLAWSMLRLQTVIESAANGSTGQVELNKSFIEDLDIVIPAEPIQEEFSKFVEPLVKEIARRECENELLTNKRDWLLPMLMNGQVTVK
ncbi:MAG: restriction endonuclease subunit S [Methylococcales bacterium]|nr:restriction endonuclease subunit S [Methylococcales bacterium]